MPYSYDDPAFLEEYAAVIEKTARLYEACQVHALPVDCRFLASGCGLTAPSSLAAPDGLALKEALARLLLPSGSLMAPEELMGHVLAPRILIHRLDCCTSRQLQRAFCLPEEMAVRVMEDYRRWFSFVSRTARRPLPQEERLEALFFPSAKNRPRQAVPAKRPSPASRRREREMDLRASFFRELGEIYGEERLFCMLEEQWVCGPAV